MILTYKTRIYPTEDQEQVLWDLAEQCRLLYNFALTERKVIWEQEKDSPFRRFSAIFSLDGNGRLLKSDLTDYFNEKKKIIKKVYPTVALEYGSDSQVPPSKEGGMSSSKIIPA